MAPLFKKLTGPELYHPDYPNSDDAISDDGDNNGFEDVSDDDDVDEKQCSTTLKPNKTGTKASSAKSGKEWFLPDSDQDYTNFTDHGCNFDKEGYPLYPNGNTTFFQLPPNMFKNFGKVGYSKRSAVNYRRERTWKVTRHTCLGVLVCDNNGYSDINFAFPKAKCAVKVWQAEVKKNPKAGAFELKLGKPTDSSAPFESVTSIHPAFQNKDRVAYYRRKTLIELNLVPDKLGRGVGDKFIMDMFSWAARGLFIVSSSYMPENEHFTFQTRWMQERLLARNKENKLYDGGLLSDVTYRYFENGYLLTTSMFCDELSRWIPVQISWIRGLSTEYYYIHFAVLFRQFLKAQITPLERDDLVLQVVDFSKAQTEGFISAYIDVFRQGTREEVGRLLKGCRQHYRNSITRVKRNRSLIYADEEEPFRAACMDLLEHEQPDGKSHEQKVDYIRRRWPKVKKWLDWWTTADVEAQLFKCRRPRLEDSPETAYDRLPETTNAQESMHRLYYMISDGKQCLLVGMVELFAFVTALEDDWKSVMNGVPINYGSQKTQDVGLSMGLVKKRKRQTQTWTDGRPPDTTDTLLDGPGENTKPKKLGRPLNAASFDKNQFSTYVSYRRNTTNLLLANRCWLSASLESLYALFSPLWVCCISGFGKDLFTYLVEHFNSRSTYELTYQGTIRSSMTRAQTKIANHANELFPGRFKPGDFASADFFLEISLDPKLHKSPWYKELFLVNEHCTFTCEAFPDGLQSHPLRADRSYHVLSVTPQMFSYNRIPYSDVKRLLDSWQQSGLLGISGLVCKECNVPQRLPKPKKKSKLKRVDSGIDVVLDYSQPASAHYIIDRSTLSFDKSGPPLHLYFHLNLSTLAEQLDQRAEFMGTTNWPFKISVGGSTYTLISRGYWNSVHYWCKVLRSSAGLTAVWSHDEADNDGYARLTSRVPSAISGPSPQTSWLMYSRVWTSSEEQAVDKAIDKIRSDHPNPVGVLPFTDLKAIVNMSHNSTTTSHKDTTPPSVLIAPAAIASAEDPFLDGNLEIKHDDCGRFEFMDNDMADLEAQIQAATEQLAKEKTLFAQQTEETKPEKPRTTKKIKIVEPLTSWDEEPSLEEKKVTMFPPPPPKVLKKIRPTKLVRPLTAEKPAENDLAHVENKPIKPPFRLKIIPPADPRANAPATKISPVPSEGPIQFRFPPFHTPHWTCLMWLQKTYQAACKTPRTIGKQSRMRLIHSGVHPGEQQHESDLAFA
ncbi:hypothetical protein PSHT_03689 [Puccinia striiformis]|uniref:GCM domain-containing protein n=1 Tax=Puccinia striiformis TaxID=27350 RepID=A0A2S4WEU5_9BASI|nr:hypothetical protein PSHT_03689 [Puccinia striiformis]